MRRNHLFQAESDRVEQIGVLFRAAESRTLCAPTSDEWSTPLLNRPHHNRSASGAPISLVCHHLRLRYYTVGYFFFRGQGKLGENILDRERVPGRAGSRRQVGVEGVPGRREHLVAQSE